MGCLSNGTEGMDYQARYCRRCVQYQPDLEKLPCPVWAVHLLYAYEGRHKEVLDMLIPLTQDGLGNEQCTMFLARGD